VSRFARGCRVDCHILEGEYVYRFGARCRFNADLDEFGFGFGFKEGGWEYCLGYQGDVLDLSTNFLYSNEEYQNIVSGFAGWTGFSWGIGECWGWGWR
jgi:hypothetical protein